MSITITDTAQARCPVFNSQRLPAISLSSIFASKHYSLYSNVRQDFSTKNWGRRSNVLFLQSCFCPVTRVFSRNVVWGWGIAFVMRENTSKKNCYCLGRNLKLRGKFPSLLQITEQDYKVYILHTNGELTRAVVSSLPCTRHP